MPTDMVGKHRSIRGLRGIERVKSCSLKDLAILLRNRREINMYRIKSAQGGSRTCRVRGRGSSPTVKEGSSMEEPSPTVGLPIVPMKKILQRRTSLGR